MQTTADGKLLTHTRLLTFLSSVLLRLDTQVLFFILLLWSGPAHHLHYESKENLQARTHESITFEMLVKIVERRRKKKTLIWGGYNKKH